MVLVGKRPTTSGCKSNKKELDVSSVVASKMGVSAKEKFQEEYSDLDSTDDGKDYCKLQLAADSVRSPQRPYVCI